MCINIYVCVCIYIYIYIYRYMYKFYGILYADLRWITSYFKTKCLIVFFR